MKGRVVLSKLKPLPAVQILDLTLNDIGEADVDWACQAVKELQPVGNHKGYMKVDCNMIIYICMSINSNKFYYCMKQ